MDEHPRIGREKQVGPHFARRTVIVAGLLWLATVNFAYAAQPPARYDLRRVRMGVVFTLSVYAPDEATASTAADAAFARLKDLNATLSDYDPESELSRLTRDATPGVPVPVSRDLLEVLTRAQHYAELSGGAFDPTVGPVVRLWRHARRTRQVPPPEQLRNAVAAVGWRHLTIDPAGSTVTLDRRGLRLDVGGIAKGYACDAALAVLKEHGLPQALIEAGGDLAIGDPPPGKPGWTIGIAALATPDAPPTRTVTLSNCGIATSGDAYQFLEIDGVRYSHLVDPTTGLGLTKTASVTVIAPDGTAADALASAVSVLGPQRGLAMLQTIDGAAMLMVTLDQTDAPQEVASPGFPAN